jgi:hypothetical protein
MTNVRFIQFVELVSKNTPPGSKNGAPAACLKLGPAIPSRVSDARRVPRFNEVPVAAGLIQACNSVRREAAQFCRTEFSFIWVSATDRPILAMPSGVLAQQMPR